MRIREIIHRNAIARCMRTRSSFQKFNKITFLLQIPISPSNTNSNACKQLSGSVKRREMSSELKSITVFLEFGAK